MRLYEYCTVTTRMILREDAWQRCGLFVVVVVYYYYYYYFVAVTVLWIVEGEGKKLPVTAGVAQ